MSTLALPVLFCAAQVTVVAAVAAALATLARPVGPAASATACFSALMVTVALAATLLCPWPNWLPLEAVRPTSLVSPGVEQRVQTGPGPAVAAAEPASAAGAGSQLVSDERFWVAFVEALMQPRFKQPDEAATGFGQWASTCLGCAAFVLVALSLVGVGRLIAGLLTMRLYLRSSRPLSERRVTELAAELASRLGCTCRFELRQSGAASVPATFRWRRPVILLPAGWQTWPEDELRAVLAHELAHICRNDFPALLAAQFALALHFYHPLVHWLANRFRLAQEWMADALAAGVVGGRQPYLSALAALALRQSSRSVSWSARAFLPTRGTMLRRIEMLKDSSSSAVSMRLCWRLAIAGIVVATGFGAAGLRTPRSSPTPLVAAEQAAAEGSQPQGKRRAFSLAYVPRDAFLVAAARPAELINAPGGKQMANLFAELLKLLKGADLADPGLELARTNSITCVFLVAEVRRPEIVAPGAQATRPGTARPPRAPQPAAVIIRSQTEVDAKKVSAALVVNPTKAAHEGKLFYRNRTGDQACCYFPDCRTVVFAFSEAFMRRLIMAGRQGASGAKWADAWGVMAEDDAALLINLTVLRGLMELEMAHGPQQAKTLVAPFRPLWEEADAAAIGLSIRGKKLSLRGMAFCRDEGGARRFQDALVGAMSLARNAISKARQSAAASAEPEGQAARQAMDLAEAFLEHIKIRQTGKRVQLAATLPAADKEQAVSVLASAMQAARRMQATNRLKEIGLAMHLYHADQGHFPAAAIYDERGRPLLSWRVALLPYLGYQRLYQQFHLNEPWDSAHNRKLIARMPAVYRHPSDAPNSPYAAWYVFTGPETVFCDKHGTSMREIIDGLTNTILAVEAKRAVPWTKPEDIPYDAEKPLPALGGFYEGGFHALFCDGAVRFLSAADESRLRAMISKAGREIISTSRGQAGPAPAAVRPPPVAARAARGLAAPDQVVATVRRKAVAERAGGEPPWVSDRRRQAYFSDLFVIESGKMKLPPAEFERRLGQYLAAAERAGRLDDARRSLQALLDLMQNPRGFFRGFPESWYKRYGKRMRPYIAAIQKHLKRSLKARTPSAARSIQGTWKFVAAYDGGRPAPPAQIRNATVVISADQIAVRMSGKTAAQFNYRLDPLKGWIDLMTEGRSALGLYELKGNRLKICYSERSGGHRPDRFVSEPDSDNDVLWVLERIRADQRR